MNCNIEHDKNEEISILEIFLTKAQTEKFKYWAELFGIDERIFIMMAMIIIASHIANGKTSQSVLNSLDEMIG